MADRPPHLHDGEPALEEIVNLTPGEPVDRANAAAAVREALTGRHLLKAVHLVKQAQILAEGQKFSG
jgi:hypothetical protein